MTENGGLAIRPTSQLPRRSLITCGLSLLIFIGLLFYPQGLQKWFALEHSKADWRTIWLSDQAPTAHPALAIVTIDPETRSLFKADSPTNRHLLAELVKKIDAAGARAIGIDIKFWKETNEDEELLAAIAGTRNAEVILGAGLVDALEHQKAFQSAFIAKTGRKAGHLSFDFDIVDDVARHKWIAPNDAPYPVSFSTLLARTVMPNACSCSKRIAWLQTPRDGGDTFLRLSARTIYLAGSPAEVLPFAAIAEQLKSRIVLIGLHVPVEDQHRTPLYFASEKTVPGVEIHAQLIAELLDERSVVELSRPAERFVLCLFAFAGFYLMWRLRSSRRMLFGWSLSSAPISWGALTIIFIVVDALVFAQLHIILPFVLCVAALFVGMTGGYHARELMLWAFTRT